MIEQIESRLKKIDENIKNDEIWKDMQAFADDMMKMLDGCNIIRKIELKQNDLSGGSVNFYFTTLPENMTLKLLYSSDSYYMSFFTTLKGTTIEEQVTGIFENDFTPLKGLDEFETKLLDYCANQIYTMKNLKTLFPKNDDAVFPGQDISTTD